MGGPMLTALTLPPCFSLRRRPVSMANSSKGLITAATPSRLRRPVSLSNSTSVVSGTCFMQTMMLRPTLNEVSPLFAETRLGAAV